MTSAIFKKEKKVFKKKNNNKRETTIRGKFVSVIAIMCIIMLSGTATVLRGMMLKEINILNENYLREKSIAVSNEAKEFFDKYTMVAEVLTTNPTIQNYFISNTMGSEIDKNENFEEVLEIIKNAQQNYSDVVSAVFLAEESPSHILTSSDSFVFGYIDVTETAYSDTLKDGKIHVSEPYVDTNTGDMAVTISVPVIVNGVIEGEVCTDIQLDTLEMITANSDLGETGYFTLVTGDNVIAYSRNPDFILKNINDVNLDSSLTKAIIEESSEIINYIHGGEGKVGMVNVIGDTGWKIVSTMSTSEFTSGIDKISNIIVLGFIIVQALIIGVLFTLVTKMTKPIKQVQMVAEKMANGELDVDVNIKSNDEIGKLAQSISSLSDRLKTYIGYINETSEVLDDFAEGDFRVNLKQDYTGEFKKIKDALVNVSVMQKDVLGEIKESTEIINNGSEQIASGAQATSQGATEQASAIEELSAEINVLAEVITKTADEALSAGNKSVEATTEVEAGNRKMQELLIAINEISQASGQIKKVIKVIDDIAFQTNILALNAAVEAARAGSAGKGFAVVADEVRNLAGKSAEAAKETTTLIENSLLAIEKGTSLAGDTGKSLESVVIATEEANELIKEIVQDAKNGAVSIEQIKIGIEQVSAVIQGNAAAAEESAANSEELAAQVERLNEMIDRFKL